MQEMHRYLDGAPLNNILTKIEDGEISYQQVREYYNYHSPLQKIPGDHRPVRPGKHREKRLLYPR